MKIKQKCVLRLSVIYFLLCILVMIGCETTNEDHDRDENSPTDEVKCIGDFSGNDDPQESDLPPYLAENPTLTGWSLWQSDFDADNPIELYRLGGFGIGNGHVFSLVAARPPFSTLHNIAGPVYQKHFKFFSDKLLSLYKDSLPVKWEKHRAYRIRDTSVILTRADSGNISLWTIDFAPVADSSKNDVAEKTILRTIILHNRGDEAISNLTLEAGTVIGSVQQGLIVERISDNDQYLAAGFVPGDFQVEAGGKSIVATVPQIEPGEQFLCRFLMAFSKDTPATSTFNSAVALDHESLLESTIDYWKESTDNGARIVTSNQRFDDLLEGLAQTMKVQQAAGGCFAQMSEYGYNALRDMYGIARFYPLIGRNEEYKQMLDYVWQAELYNGDITADVRIDLEFDPQQPEPDWENLPTLTGRSKAESPSYLVLMHKEYVNATGDWQPALQRYEMLRHALIHQDFRDGCLLPFSDDETFRISMMAAFGHNLFEGYEDKYLSANSSFLFVVAAEFLAQVATQLGLPDDASEYQQMADDVRQCTEDYYWLSGEYYTPIIDINTLEPVDQVFEDVNTKPLWLGYLEPEDAKAKTNIEHMMEQLQYKEGLYYSPVHPRNRFFAKILGVDEGFITGMTPGFQLDNLARLDHPDAEASFLLMDKFFHDTGNVSEGQIVDDFGRLSYLYEPFGFLCDLTARFRSWEGAIDAAAMIQYLFGLELDALQNRIAIAPHLPQGWSFARMESARIGDTFFDVSVENEGQIRRVEIDNATNLLTVDAQVSVQGTIQSVEVNGEQVYPAIETNWGRSRALLPDLTVSPKQSLTIEVLQKD